MGKQDNANSGARLYSKAKRVQTMAQWFSNTYPSEEARDLIWEARFLADQASRLSVVQANLQANGLWVPLPVAETEERLRVLESRLSYVLYQWIIPNPKEEAPVQERAEEYERVYVREVQVDLTERPTCRRCGGPRSNPNSAHCWNCIGEIKHRAPRRRIPVGK